MERIKLILFTKKYENELRKENTEHLRDYIGARVVLALSLAPTVICSDEINNTTLNNLICPFNDNKIIDYKVPSLQYVNNIQNYFNLYLKNNFGIPVNMIHANGAATWIGLMLECGILSEGDKIDLTQYKLIDFIHDKKLKKLLGVSEVVDYNLVGDNKIVYDKVTNTKSRKRDKKKYLQK